MQRAPRAVVIAAILFTASILNAQQWTGSIGVAVSGRDVAGSEESFRSQTDLRGGFALDELTLARSGEGTTFTFSASGFGNSEPDRRARAEVRFKAPLTLSMSYDRRASFFALGESAIGLRRDDWTIERWNMRAAWDGWQAAKVSLNLRHTARDGSSIRPFYGLNETYPLFVGLDETMDEATIRFDTKATPVQFSFEQAFAHHHRRDRTAPAGANAIGTTDPDTFLAALTDRSDRQNIPTSRAVATYGTDKVEMTTSVRYAPARLNSSVPVTTTFGVNGGAAGNISFIDGVAGWASRDSVDGVAKFAVRVAPRWIVRFTGDYRDASTDATLLGERLVRMVNPQGGEVDLTAALGARNIFTFTDASERLEIERSGEHLIFRAGALASQRDVKDVHRRSTGGSLTLGWRSGRFSTSADFEHGTFEHFIFRSDPETVDRFRLWVTTPLRAGWTLQGDGRFERGDNPQSVAALAHRSNSGGLDLSWAPAARDADAGLSFGTTSLRTRTDLVLPGNVAGVSRYDLSLITATAHGRAVVGRTTLAGSATRTRDQGSTWPVGTWNANGRATFRGPAHFDYGVFGEYWNYDERRSSVDDFDVLRYGVVLVWRFE